MTKKIFENDEKKSALKHQNPADTRRHRLISMKKISLEKSEFAKLDISPGPCQYRVKLIALSFIFQLTSLKTH